MYISATTTAVALTAIRRGAWLSNSFGVCKTRRYENVKGKWFVPTANGDTPRLYLVVYGTKEVGKNCVRACERSSKAIFKKNI